MITPQHLFYTRWHWPALLLGHLLALLLLVLPRLIGGAHWLADVAVGGVTMALVTLSWAFASPLEHWLNQALLQGAMPLFRLTR